MEISVIGSSRMNLGRYNLGFCSCNKILNSKMGDSNNSEKLKGRNLCQSQSLDWPSNLLLVAALEPPPLHKMELMSFLRSIQKLQESSLSMTLYLTQPVSIFVQSKFWCSAGVGELFLPVSRILKIMCLMSVEYHIGGFRVVDIDAFIFARYGEHE